MKNLRELLKKTQTNFAPIQQEYEEKLTEINKAKSYDDFLNINDTERAKKRFNQLAIDRYSHSIEVERVIGKNHLMDINFLKKGVEVSKTVCRLIRFKEEIKQPIGTGFLVGPNLLMTNFHVINSKRAARRLTAEFEYEKNEQGQIKNTTLFQFNPDVFFLNNETLDYTIIALSPIAINQPSKKLVDYGYNKLTNSSHKIMEGERVSIIQHPEGLPKMMAIRDNRVVKIHNDFIHYTTDTQKGSSGSLVANDQWSIVALHRSGVAAKDDNDNYLLSKGGVYKSEADEPFICWIANQGVLMDSILADIKQRQVSGEDQQILKKVLLKHYVSNKKTGEYRLPKRR